MPIYDYVCGACGTTTEVVHGIHDDGPRYCPACGAKGKMKKAFTLPTIVFKGSGWAKKDRSSTATSGSSRKTDTKKTTDTAKSTPDGDSSSGASSSTAESPTKSATTDG